MSLNYETFENQALDERILHVKHSSGLDVYVLPKKGFSKYYAIYGTDYGSIDNEFIVPGESGKTKVPDGIAHYLEHKMFEQSSGGNAFDLFAGTGASSNAFTSFDLTAYLFTCTDKFYENLDILLGFVNDPYFTEENVAKEQGIIGQEIRMYDDDPDWRVFFNALGAMFKNHPVKIDIAGTVESIAKITPEVLYKCYNTFYAPSNMALVLVGDIDIERAMECVQRVLGDKENKGLPEHLPPNEPGERVCEVVTQKLSVSRPMFRAGFKETGSPMDGKQQLEAEILTDIILEVLFGRSSEFYTDLYERGLIDASFSKETEISHSYGFTLVGGESSEPKTVYEEILSCINKAAEGGIEAEDIERAKRILIGSEIRGFNSVENMGNAAIRRLLSGVNPMDYSSAVKSVTQDMVMERLKEHFNTSNAVLSIVEPM